VSRARSRKSGPKSQQGRLADMSLPPEERGRRGQGKRQVKAVGGTPPAQLDHATSGKARRKAREGQRKMERDRRDRD
jgi:hypothetical protein